MKITEEFNLGFDRYNVIIKQRFEKKEGKGKDAKGTGEYDYKDVAFCKDIETACRRILQFKIHDSEAADIAEMIEVIKGATAEINEHIEAAGIDYRQLMIDAGKKKEAK